MFENIGEIMKLENFRMPEEFTVTQQDTGETWTRNTKKGAIGLADNIARQRKQIAVVSLTETGWVEHTATPEKAEAA